MNAGRELDAMVAEKVMGWTTIYGANEEGEEYAEFLDGDGKEVGWVYGELADLVDLPAYSTDIAAAWRVVEHFDTCEIQRRYQLHRPGQPPFFWTAGLSKHDPEMDGEAEAPTAPLAICLAAIAAVGAALPQTTPNP